MFAVEVHGEGDGEARLSELSRQAHDAVGRSFRPVYRPHVSFGVFNGDGSSAVDEAESFAAQCKPFDFKIESVGVFPVTPGVVYAAPVPTAALLALHLEFVRAFGAFAEALIPYYRASAWVPHATLLMPASVSEQGAAVAAIAEGWQPFDFPVSRLGVVRVPDAHVIAEFPLSG